MKLLKVGFNRLNNLGFFNHNYKLITPRSDIARYLDNFIMSPCNYKQFLNAYIKLQEYISANPESYYSVKDYILYLLEFNCLERTELLSGECSALVILLLNTLVQYFPKSELRTLLEILADPDLSEDKTISMLNTYLEYDLSYGRKITFSTVTDIFSNLVPNLIFLLYYDLVADDLFQKFTHQSKMVLTNYIKDNIRSVFQLKNTSILNALVLFSSDSLKSFQPIVRRGFLSDVNNSGKTFIKNIGVAEYILKEQIHSKGTTTFYLISTPQITLRVIEESSSNKIFLNVEHPLIKFCKPSKLFQTCIDIFLEIRNIYLSLLQDSNSLSHTVRYLDSSACVRGGGNYYQTQTIVEPHIRRLPVGFTPSNESLHDAKLYGFTLKPGETFVHQFPRNVRHVVKKTVKFGGERCVKKC